MTQKEYIKLLNSLPNNHILPDPTYSRNQTKISYSISNRFIIALYKMGYIDRCPYTNNIMKLKNIEYKEPLDIHNKAKELPQMNSWLRIIHDINNGVNELNFKNYLVRNDTLNRNLIILKRLNFIKFVKNNSDILYIEKIKNIPYTLTNKKARELLNNKVYQRKMKIEKLKIN